MAIKKAQNRRQLASKRRPAPSQPKKKEKIRSSSKATARTGKSRSSPSSTAKACPSFKMGKYFAKLTMSGPKGPKTASIICDLLKIFNDCLQQLHVPIQVENIEVRAGFADED